MVKFTLNFEKRMIFLSPRFAVEVFEKWFDKLCQNNTMSLHCQLFATVQHLSMHIRQTSCNKNEQM